MRIAIIGATGSGKTTQSKLLARHLSVPIVSVGEMLRELAKKTGPRPQEVRTAFAQGKLVSRELAQELLRKRLSQIDIERGFVLDGMPRTAAEALEMRGLFSLHRVFHLQLDLEAALKRLIERGREDDTAELIRRRFKVYQREIEPILNFYRGLGILIEIDASASPEGINRKAISHLQ